MARTVTATAVKKLISKGLTGWEAGKLVMQDFVNCHLGLDSVLTDADLAGIQQLPLHGADIRDYNMFGALWRGFHTGLALGQWSCSDACLELGHLEGLLRDADERRTVSLFESFGPRIVTRAQYEDIVTAQRERKLAFAFDLGYVIEERFSAIAPPEARAAIDEAAVEVESLADFLAVVPEAYAEQWEQAIDQIRRLCTGGKLPVTYDQGDADDVKALLRRWKRKRLSVDATSQLADTVCVTGQALYDCAGLPEWKPFIDQYQRHWGDEDERFRFAYAIIQDCPEVWLDENGCYKAPVRPSEWITRSAEHLVGLRTHRGEVRRTVEQAGDALRGKLDAAKRNVRFFLAVKAVLDATVEAVGLEIPFDGGILAGPHLRLDAFINLYNLRLDRLMDERPYSSKAETKLERALRNLPTINVEALKPSPESLRQLNDNILDDATGEKWLRTKVVSLDCGDGVRLEELMN